MKSKSIKTPKKWTADWISSVAEAQTGWAHASSARLRSAVAVLKQYPTLKQVIVRPRVIKPKLVYVASPTAWVMRFHNVPRFTPAQILFFNEIHLPLCQRTSGAEFKERHLMQMARLQRQHLQFAHKDNYQNWNK
jgi:hypothetical protein